MQQTQNPTMLFDNKFIAASMKTFLKCPKCRNEYSTKFELHPTENRKTSNRAILLPCGHNMCENCVHNYRQNLTCCECLRPIELQSNVNNIRASFGFNSFLHGQLCNWRFFTTREGESVSNLQVLSAFSKRQEAVRVEKCNECELKTASGKCEKCRVFYCRPCFDKVHNNSKVLKTHTLKKFPLDDSKNVALPREKNCRRHKRLCDHYCRKCRTIICLQCAKHDHTIHDYKSLVEENESYKDDVLSLLEAIKGTRDNVRKSQKNIKSTEKQLEEYALQTVQDVTEFFLSLHSFLQLEEQKMLAYFRDSCQLPQQKIRDALAELSDKQSTINNMRAQIEFFSRKPPSNLHLPEIMSVVSNQLEQLPCHVQISQIDTNPYIFEPHKNPKAEIRKLFRGSTIEPRLTIRIGPMYDTNRSLRDADTIEGETFDDLMTSYYDNQDDNNKAASNKKNQAALLKAISLGSQCKCSSSSVAASISTSFSGKRALAQIMHITSPDHFYIQLQSAIPMIRSIDEKFVESKNSMPKVVAEGKTYMVYHVSDKAWYRAVVKKTVSKETYKVFLLDFGLEVEVPENGICDIDEENLTIPPAAIRCSIYDIIPAEKCWNDECRSLMVDIIQNNPIQMYVHEEVKANQWKVDIFTTHTPEPISVRDAFLYTGLALEVPSLMETSPRKKIAPMSKIKQRLMKHHYQPGTMFRAKIIHIENPQEFYAIKLDQYANMKAMCEELNATYSAKNNANQKIFNAQLQMSCAVLIAQKWFRACVEEIKSGGKVRIRLVDEGSYETVNWKQMYMLEEKFSSYKEFAFECCLVDLEPLQEQDYIWSDIAIADFAQMTKNPSLQITICSTKQSQSYKVMLHVTRKQTEMNIGAMLVKFKHAVSTGEGSQMRNTHRKWSASSSALAAKRSSAAVVVTKEKSPVAASVSTNAKPRLTLKTLKRTAIKIVHIENPGEFYVQLVDFLPGLMDFHQQIQLAQSNMPDSPSSSHQIESKDWNVGDHCLVYTSSKTSAGGLQQFPGWYRAIIKDIDYESDLERPFVVFLRDKGRTIRSIRKDVLAPIDSLFDRVTNGAFRCHLACVQPTGGVGHWSHSAIDQFKYEVDLYESLGATKQGTAKDGSIPVVLWGMNIETADALAPCITKYTNINRQLVCAGLAHLVEKLDITLQMDGLMQMEIAEGEQTLQDWYKNFNSTIGQLTEEAFISGNMSGEITMLNDTKLPEFVKVDQMLELSLPAAEVEQNDAEEWLPAKPIAKTLFAAYPTYVDYGGYIYLHDAESHEFLIQLRTNIAKIFGKKPEPTEFDSDYWCVGRPCLAKYHLDGKLYRAIIQRIQADQSFQVRFVDYGNVENCLLHELRPHAPYPNIAIQASKYELDGICPVNSDSAYTTDVLDVIHATIVDKLVSVRVIETDLGKSVMRCDIRISNEDLASYLIKAKHVDSSGNGTAASAVRRKYRNMNPIAANIDPVVLLAEPANQDEDDLIMNEIERKMQLAVDRDEEDENDDQVTESGEDDIVRKLNISHNSISIEEEDDLYEDVVNKNDNFDDPFDKYMECMQIDDDGNMLSGGEMEIPAEEQTFLPPPPPAKKRMFAPDEYNQMFEKMKYDKSIKRPISGGGGEIQDLAFGEEDENWVGDHYLFDDAADAVGDDAAGVDACIAEDEDVIELEYSFRSKYWHEVTAEDVNDNDDDDDTKSTLSNRKSRGNSRQKNDDIASSEFENFKPGDSSSLFSHFSGIEMFKMPRLPTGVKSFTCDVVFIRSPIILHIFPHMAELKYREIELDRRIQHLAKKAPPLQKLEPKTICLARYTKDKLWYRAIVRSYNAAGGEVDVLYVDFLNIESVPTKSVRTCPSELVAWPLRTFEMKLANLRPNARMRPKDVQAALNKCIDNRVLYARITRGSHRKSGEKLTEITLYESKKTPLNKPIYEQLIIDKYYSCE